MHFLKGFNTLPVLLLSHGCEREYLLVCLVVVRQVYKKEILLERLIFFPQSKPCVSHHLKCCSLTPLNYPHDNNYLKLNTRKSLCYLKNGYGYLCQAKFYLFFNTFLKVNNSSNLLVNHRLFPKLISSAIIIPRPSLTE